MKAQSKAKEVGASSSQSVICEICKVFVHLFSTLHRFWSNSGQYRRDVFEAIVDLTTSAIPGCRTMPHPITVVHHACQKMILLVLTSGGSFMRNDLVRRLETIFTTVLRRDIAYAAHCATKSEYVDVQLIIRYPTDRAIRTAMFKFLVEHPSVGFQSVCRLVLTEMLHSTASVKADSFRSVEALEYPLRSEAIEFIRLVFGSRLNSAGPTATLVAELVALNFVKKERALANNSDNDHIVNSSIRLFKLLLANQDLFDEGFLVRAKAQLQSLQTRFSGTWNPDLISDQRRGQSFERPITPFAGIRPATTLPKLRASAGPVAKNGSKIATSKSLPSRAVTSIGFRKK
jgi:hypothetical protein